MGYYDDSKEYLNELGDTFAKNTDLKVKLGMTESSDYYKPVEYGLNFCETKTLLHIADELKRIADSLEKLVSPLSSFEDKGVRERKGE